jgi:uncharacterized protein YegP (UPF0339 family)
MFSRSILAAFVLASVSALSTTACTSATEGAASVDESNQTQAGGRFEVYEGIDGQHYFRLFAGNGENVLRSEGYSSRNAALEGLNAARDLGRRSTAFEVLPARDGQFYFNLLAANGKVVATASETYASESNAKRGSETVASLLRGNPSMADAQSGARFEVFQGKDSKFYFRFRAQNGEIVLQSQGYSTRSAAKRGMLSVRTNGETSSAYELLAAWGKLGSEHYFRLKAGNGQIIARGEVYASRAGAEKGVATMVQLLRDTRVQGEDLGGGNPACALGDTYADLYESTAFEVVKESRITPSSSLSELDKKQIIAAVKESSHDDVTTADEAIRRVDQEVIERVELRQKSTGKVFVALEYGAGDNSYGGIFLDGSADVVAGIHDGDLSGCN